MRREWRPIPGGLIWAAKLDFRAIAFAERYRKGETLDAIGKSAGITRERVRQILKPLGIKREHGGRAIISLLNFRGKREKKLASSEHRERSCLRRYGITLAQYNDHVSEWGASTNPRSPLRRFIEQRRNANKRGIEWQFTFAEWWSIWQESGKWEQRGRGQGYCMARYGDSGPYSPANVYICTVGQNFSDSYLVDHPRRKRSDPNSRGIKLVHYPVKDGRHWYAKIVGAPGRGAFKTREDAAAWAHSARVGKAA